ncbi:MAG: FIST C-terminal domain-containing protein [Deltaproteobacteria bacterium]|nr:FIST C-terminal domain-containing protein [Deltaproteobacteria bacterium]
MGVSVGVGSSTLHASREAGREAARRAVERLSGAPALVLVFATVGFDQRELLRGIVDVTGAAPLAGCSGTGIITHAGSDESAFCVAVMALSSDGVHVRTAVGREVSHDVRGAAEAIAAAVRATPDPRVILLFPDGLKANASALLSAIDARLPAPLPILGGSAGEVMRFDRTYQYHDGEVLEDAVVGAVLGGPIDLDLEVTHGCTLLGLVHEVTNADDGLVREIDGRPAWDVMKEYVTDPSKGLSSPDQPYLCMAQPLPGPSGGEGEHLIRVPLGLDESTGALFFPGGLARGDELTMARRDAEKIARNATEAAHRLRARHPDRAPALVLQFDCAGRGASLYGPNVTSQLIQPVQQVLGKDVPWIGFHSYGELAPLRGRNHFHQYTMALCALYHR